MIFTILGCDVEVTLVRSLTSHDNGIVQEVVFQYKHDNNETSNETRWSVFGLSHTKPADTDFSKIFSQNLAK